MCGDQSGEFAFWTLGRKGVKVKDMHSWDHCQKLTATASDL